MARRAAVSSKVIDRGWNAEVSHVRRLAGRGVKIGVQAGAGSQEGIDLLDILIWNEFGTERIPARPVMRSYFDGAQAEIAREANLAAGFILRTGAVDAGLNRLGAFLQAGTQKHWRASKTWAVPNAPYTIRMKGSDVPLIDHAVLVNSVRWQLV